MKHVKGTGFLTSTLVYDQSTHIAFTIAMMDRHGYDGCTDTYTHIHTQDIKNIHVSFIPINFDVNEDLKCTHTLQTTSLLTIEVS